MISRKSYFDSLSRSNIVKARESKSHNFSNPANSFLRFRRYFIFVQLWNWHRQRWSSWWRHHSHRSCWNGSKLWTSWQRFDRRRYWIVWTIFVNKITGNKTTTWRNEQFQLWHFLFILKTWSADWVNRARGLAGNIILKICPSYDTFHLSQFDSKANKVMEEIRVFVHSKEFIQFCNVCTNGRFCCSKFRAKQCYIFYMHRVGLVLNSTKASLVRFF